MGGLFSGHIVEIKNIHNFDESSITVPLWYKKNQ